MSPLVELDAVAAEVRELREWFRSTVLSCQRRDPGADAFAASQRLNELLEADDKFNTLVASADGSRRAIELISVRRIRGARSLLPILAEERQRTAYKAWWLQVVMPAIVRRHNEQTRSIGMLWADRTMFSLGKALSLD